MFFFRNTNKTSGEEIRKEIESNAGIIIDVRTAAERAIGTLPGTQAADWLSGEVHENASSWDPEKHYYLYCRSGNRSRQATSFLKAQGFKNVTNIGAYGDLKNSF
ncbi:MAG: rhodanese-like domain-containing protein [Flavobacteriales bacterium]|nr:rhodanese-like domain-containing protein [Flavobacteriales bacterium]